MVMTNVTKETKIKFLNVDTKFCDEYMNNRTDPSNNSFNLAKYNITIPDRINDVKSISVLNAEIPMTFYNISSVLGNNCFKINFILPDTVSFNIIIPDGQYTIDSLIAKINSFFGYSPLINDTNYYPRFGFDSVSNKVFVYLSQSTSVMTIDFAVNKTGEFDKFNFKSKLGWLLGFRQSSYTLYGIDEHLPINPYQNNVLIAENYHFFIPRYFYLAIDEYSKGNQNSFISALPNSSINKNIIAKISLDFQFYPFNSVLNANRTNGLLMSDMRSYTGKIDIQKLNIQLLDDIGRPVNLNGSDFSFGLVIEHE
jgi:hypothetical protein